MRASFGFFFICLMGLLPGLSPVATAQLQCAERLSFTPVTQPNLIEWSKFPDFSLPFPIIYGGPRFSDTQASPLRHGFSQLVDVRDNEFGSLVKPAQRAVVYYGVATGLGQPWETIESPWANDLNAYRANWDSFLSGLAGGQKNSAGLYILPISRLALDIERILETDTRILRIKTDTRVPAQYRNLSDANFIAAYKRDMRNLYAEAARYIRQHADLTNISLTSYADSPVLNTYMNVSTFSWADWSTNLARTNYLVQDSTGRSIGGPYYEQLNSLSPSAYYFYDYPNPFARQYLAYLLFQVEVNRAWSPKPVVPWVWLRYHDSSTSYPNFIQRFMAEATAIFPFFSGAAGLWLWENPTLTPTRTDTYAAYEHFTHGLYRLSRFADMFQGTYELVIETPARDLLDKELPVWRGVAKGNKILVAAQNPYAEEGAKTNLTVRYKTWQQTIELTGREVYLCQFDMGVVTANEPVLANMTVFPNPAQTTLTVTFGRLPATPTSLTLLNTSGQPVVKREVNTLKESVNIANLPAGIYFLRVQSGDQIQSKKIVIQGL
ncbi:T9SS type A sorting domain-containing protein [Spirosoma fluviale]|uniref:Por secretion system C-terminal sorting domain-containing protein n=1 Tax=Spirosoma fluviale TaxID=1597977 RepID=A0A286FG86_9BACT|nr:T9SS type A sorting domain-containing protein [Spirosoma fluviale]SOD82230.1 Por secretion system C-terminal sorting domain-containing protein [Spirosoma fluviale]